MSRRNVLTKLERKTDALRKGMSRTDLAWNPSLKRQLKDLLSRSEAMVSQLHEGDLQHRLYGSRQRMVLPTSKSMKSMLDELSYAGLLFQPTGRTNRRGQRIVEEPKSPQEALILALMMAIEAPTSRQSKEAIGLAIQIMDRFRLSPGDLQRAQASADMLIKVRELQVEGKSVDDLMREGTLLTTPFGGPVGEANIHTVDGVATWLWVLAENPQEIDRLLKASPKKARKSAQVLYDEIRKRHQDEVPRNYDSLQGLIYLNLFASQIAPDAAESAILFARAAEVLSRAMKQKLPFTQKDVAGVVKQSMDSVRASVAMQEMVESFTVPVGEANRDQSYFRSGLYDLELASRKPLEYYLYYNAGAGHREREMIVIKGRAARDLEERVERLQDKSPELRLALRQAWGDRHPPEVGKKYSLNRANRPAGALPHPAPHGGSGPVSCRWIPVSQPPSEPGSYLIFDPSNQGDPAWIGVYDLGKWWDEYGATSAHWGELEGITHWTPLPKDPRFKFRSAKGRKNTVTVIPAYGRDYKTKKAVLADWKAGKDFIIHSYGHRYDGKYINKEDADRGGETVSIRYAGRTKQLIIRPG